MFDDQDPLHLLFPRIGTDRTEQPAFVTPRRAWMFVFAGWVSVALSLLISYCVLARA
jgi:hypothetical protein